MPTYEEAVSSTCRAADTNQRSLVITRDMWGTVLTTDTLGAQVAPGVLLSSGLAMSAALGAGSTGITLRDLVRVTDHASAAFTLSWLISSAMRAVDSANTRYGLHLTDQLEVVDATEALRSLVLIDRLSLADAVFGPAFRSLSVTDRVRVVDLARNFFGLSASSGAAVAGAVAAQTVRNISLTGQVNVADAAGGTLVLRLDTVDALRLTDTQAMQAFLRATITDLVRVQVLLSSPSSITTWAVNTRRGVVSEYANYAFNSFARLRSTYLGAAEDGLYELAGDTDNGAAIIAAIKGGQIQMNGSRYAGLKAVYLGIRGEGEFYLTLRAGSGEEYVYRLHIRDMESSKVWVGKGLRHRYLSFELRSVGQDFDLDSIEFLPILAQRRV